MTAVEIHDRNASDPRQLPALVATTARSFAIAEVSADKAYGSTHNADTIANAGGTPFIAFKSNATGTGSHRAGNMGTGAWEKAFGYFLYRRDEFMVHYHKRSNVESTFSMIKRKFGHALRSKTHTAQVNETLAKILCHNLVVLIHEMYELGVDPVFGRNHRLSMNSQREWGLWAKPPRGGWGARASRARSELRRQASGRGAPGGTRLRVLGAAMRR